jgi:hypothetical protein
MVVARTEAAEKPGCVCYAWVWVWVIGLAFLVGVFATISRTRCVIGCTWARSFLPGQGPGHGGETRTAKKGVHDSNLYALVSEVCHNSQYMCVRRVCARQARHTKQERNNVGGSGKSLALCRKACVVDEAAWRSVPFLLLLLFVCSSPSA